MNTVDFGIWHPPLNESSIKILRQHAPVDRVILYSYQEFDYPKMFPYFEFVTDYSFRHNIPFYIVICTSEYVKPLHNTKSIRYKNVKIVNWGTYFLSETLYRVSQDDVRFRWPGVVPEEYSCPFIIMNGKSTAHRCMMMDVLAKHKLVEAGTATWLDYTNTACEYPFKHWTPNRLRLTEVTPLMNQYIVPVEYSRALMQIVTESSGDLLAMTEKHACHYSKRNRFWYSARPDFMRCL